MNRRLSPVAGLILTALTFSASATPIVTSDVELSDGKVIFVVHNNLAVAAVPTAVTLVGNGDCKVEVDVNRVETIGAGAKVAVAAIDLHELLQSCALRMSDVVQQFGEVSGVSGSPSAFLAKRKFGSTLARGVPFGYTVEVASIDNKNRPETFTSGYVFFTAP